MRTLLLLALSLPLYAVCPGGTTRIVSTVTTADGVAAFGRISAKGPTSPSGSVASTTISITIGTAGAVDFCLAGGVANKYTATYLLTSSTGRATNSYSETWIVPTTSLPLTISQLWGGSAAPQYLVSPQQISSAGLLTGQMWLWDGTAWSAAYPASSTGGAGSWGGITGTLCDQADLCNALAGKAPFAHVHLIADVTGLQAALDAKAGLSHVHIIGDVTGLQAALNLKEATANKGIANGYAGLDGAGKVPAGQLPSSAGMTALVQDTAPQLGGNLDMNGHNIQTVTPTEMARISGVTSAIQTQLDGKSATGHTHAGVYEPVDATLLRQANLAGSGSATTPARSDHTHTGVYAPSTHATSHQNGGADEVATATPGANAIPKAGGGGTLGAGWIPTLNQSTTGNAGTATALAALPSACSAGSYPLGVLANGNATGCTVAGGGTPGGTSGQVQANHSGAFAGVALTATIQLPVAVAQSSTGITGLSLPAANAPTPDTNTPSGSAPQVIFGILRFPSGSNTSGQYHFTAPADIDCASAVDVNFTWRAAAITNSVTWGVQAAFVASAAVADGLTFLTASEVSAAPQGTTLQLKTSGVTNITKTGCAAGSEMFLYLYRKGASDTMTGDAQLIAANLVYRRTL